MLQVNFCYSPADGDTTCGFEDVSCIFRNVGNYDKYKILKEIYYVYNLKNIL